MASVGLSDLAFAIDVLSETKFEPWWEKLRSYCMRALFVISFFIFYITNVVKPIRCISTHRSNISLFTQEILFINSYCFGQMDWMIKYSGVIPLTATAVLYLICQSWLLIPSVVNSFRTIRQVDETIGKSKLSRTEIEGLALFSRKSKEGIEGKGEISHACWKIFSRTPGCKCVPTIYLIRNLAASILLCVYVVVLCILIFTGELCEGANFYCKANREVESIVGPEIYLCSNELHLQLIPYEVAYCLISLCMLFCSSGYPFMVLKTSCKRRRRNKCCSAPEIKSTTSEKTYASETVLRLDPDHKFIEFLSEHSHHIHSTTKLLLSLPNDKSLKLMEEKGLEEAIENWDRDYIKLFLLLHKEGEKFLVEKLEIVQPWKKRDFHKNVFGIPEVFQIPLKRKEYILVANLHHHVFYARENENTEIATGIDYAFTACGCYELEWSLHKPENESNRASQNHNRDTENASFITDNDCDSLFETVCNFQSDGKVDIFLIQHFLFRLTNEHKAALRNKVNGSGLVGWLLGQKNETGRANWNEFLSVLIKHKLLFEEEINGLKRISAPCYDALSPQNSDEESDAESHEGRDNQSDRVIRDLDGEPHPKWKL